MKLFNRSILLVTIVIQLTACESNYGDVVIRDGVQVYYLEPVKKSQAIQLADYWMDKELSSKNMQYLQLSESSGILHLKMIANDSTFLVEIPFDVQLELAKLDSMLNHDLFPERDLELFVSDKTFTKTKQIF